MTVGIAALCENRMAAVLAADRMEVYGGFSGETDTSKIVEVSPTVMAACSSSDSTVLQEITDLLEQLRGSVEGRSVADLAKTAAEFHRDALHSKCERILWKIVGTDYEGLRRMIVESTKSAVLESITTAIDKTPAAVTLLMAGSGKDRMQLFRVDDAGAISYDSRGTLGIGSGGEQAVVSLLHRRYRPSFSLADALFCVYEAKKCAEIAYGVGPSTDVVILRHNKASHWLTEDEMKRLHEAYEQNRPQLLSDESRAILADIAKEA